MNPNIKTQAYKEGKTIDATAAAAYTAGQPLAIAGKVGIVQADVALGATMALAIAGLFKGALAAVTVTAGEVIGWDANGSPVGGTALSGAYTNVAADMDLRCGVATAAATNTSGEVNFLLNVFPNAVYDGTAANVAALTDNSGGVDPADDTIAVVTPAAAITDSSGGTDPGDDTIASVTNSANAGSADLAPTTAAIAQLAAKQNTTSTAITALSAAVAQLAAKLNAEIAALKAAGIQASA